MRNRQQAPPLFDQQAAPVFGWRVAFLAGAIGVMATMSVAIDKDRMNRAHVLQALATQAQQTARTIETRLQTVEKGIRGTRGAILMSKREYTTSAEYGVYAASRDLNAEFPGARGFGFIRRLPGERYIVQIVAPLAGNEVLSGLDVSARAPLRDAAESAMRNARGAMAPAPPAADADASRASRYLVMLPVYRPGQAVGDSVQRDAATIGWAFAIIDLDGMLNDIAVDDDSDVTLRDTTIPGKRTSILTLGRLRSLHEAATTASAELLLYGRTWTITAGAGRRFAERLTPFDGVWVWGVGGLLTLLASCLAGSLTASARRGVEVRAQQAMLASIVADASDAIILESLEGRIVGWNAAAERLFGYSAAQVLGLRLADLILPPQQRHADAELLARCARGERVAPFDTVRCRSDGVSMDVSITVTPFYGATGRMVGVAKTVRNISERKDAERHLQHGFDRLATEVDLKSKKIHAIEHDLRSITDSMPCMIAYWDTNLVNRFANRAHEKWYGFDSHALIGMRMPEVLGPVLFEQSARHVETVLGGQRVSFERDLPLRDSDAISHVLIHYIPDAVEGEVRGFYVLVEDITDIVDARLQLAALARENQALLQTLRANAIVSVADPSGNITEVNDGFCRLSGYTREELIGANHRIVNSRLHPPEFWRTMWRTVVDGGTWHGEVCNRSKDGALYWVDSIIAPVRDETGRVLKYISIRFDVTMLKETQRRLAESEAFLERAGNVSGVGAFRVDLRTGRQVWSRQLSRMFEVSGDPVPSLTEFEDLLAPDDRAKFQHAVRSASQTGKGFDIEIPTVTTRGRPLWIRVVGAIEFGDAESLRLVGSIQDISTRKRTELELKHTSSLLRTVLDSAADLSIIATTPDFTINVFNRGAERLLGYTSAEVVDVATPEILHDPLEIDERARQLSAVLGRSIAGVQVFAEPSTCNTACEWTYIRKDGSRIPVSLMVSAMRGENGRLKGYVAIARNITEAREQQDSLQRAMDRAEQANAAKSQFLANMSHEIRTPLNAVIGLGYLLEQSQLTEEQRSFVSKIQFGGRALLSVVNNVLDLSKIEAGEMGLEEARFDLVELVRDLGQLLTPQAHGKGIELLLRLPADLPRWVFADSTRLRQILTNLVNNAIKFTERGQVALELAWVSRNSAGAEVRFSVRDTGIGISPEGLTRLFHPFAQADASMTRRFGGTGLGLSIARRLAALMGGTIAVTSTVGIGSEFVVQIPLSIAQSIGGTETAAAHAFRLLIIEVASGAPTVSSVVRPFGWRPHSVASGEDALHWLRGTQAGSWPDVIVIDRHPSDMDALQFIARLERDFVERELPPIIALVERAYDDLPAYARLAKVCSILGHPVTSSAVFNAVNSALARRDGGHDDLLSATHLGAVEAQWLPGVQVLVVDDSDINREVAQRILEKQGAAVVTCADGAQAIERLRQSPDAFDVVLMDVQMPEIDGHEATRRIRRDLGLTGLPIIALTAGALVTERTRSLEAGMDGFLSKPFEPAELIRVLRRVVERKRNSALTVGLSGKSNRNKPLATGLPSIDLGLAQQMFGGDIALFTSVLGRVVREFQDFALPREWDDADAVRRGLAARLHKLRGSAGVIGARALGDLAAAAEKAIAAGQDHDFVEALLRELAVAFTQLMEEARPLLDKAALHAAAPPAAVPADREQLQARIEQLLEMLEAQNLDAIDHYEAIVAPLSTTLGEAAFRTLQQAIDDLEFLEAANLLRGASAFVDRPSTRDDASPRSKVNP